MAVYTYCSVILPSVNLLNNTVRNNPSTYSPDFADMYIQANCESIIRHVNSIGNSWENIGLGAIVLVSSVQSPSDGCADPMAEGTIEEFSSVNDSATNFSSSFAGVFPVINSTGSNLLRATVVGLHSNGGGGPLSLVFDTNNVYGMVVDDAPVSTVYALQDVESTETTRPMLRHRMAMSQTGNIYELKDSGGNLLANWTATGKINFESTPGAFASNGTRAQDAHMVFGPFTLVSGTVNVTLTGSAVYTSGSSYRCTANLSSGAVALLVSNGTASSFTISDGTGASASTGAYICIGN